MPRLLNDIYVSLLSLTCGRDYGSAFVSPIVDIRLSPGCSALLIAKCTNHLLHFITVNRLEPYRTGSDWDETESNYLLHRFNSNCPDAFSVIHDRYYPNVYFFARRFVGETDAQDIAADAFLKLWKHHKCFGRVSSIKVFLQVTVRNDCLSLLSAQTSRLKRENEFASATYAETLINIGLDDLHAARRRSIDLNVARMPPKMKLIFTMAYLEQISNEEIADQLGLSYNTVRCQKSKAIAFLRHSANA